MPDLVPVSDGEPVDIRIVEVRGTRVVLDQDLAALFEVETRILNQAIKRKKDRFPPDWMFQLSKAEFADLKSQSVISNDNWGGRRTLPLAFTEHGVVLASTMINSDRAVSMTQHIVEAFVAFHEQRHAAADLVPHEMKALQSPSRVSRLQAHLDKLLDLQVNAESGATLGEETQSLVGTSFEHVRERLKREGLKNAEIEERVHNMIADRRKTGAEIDQMNAQSERVRLDTQIAAVRAALIAERAMEAEDTADFIALMDAMSGS